MHAFLVVGKDKEKVREEVGTRVKAIGGRRIDYKVEGIGEVRELRKYLKLKVTEPTVYVIHDFDHVSIEAQNAFLKALEEPQESLSFILTTENEEGVLPTIKSRCFVIQTGGEVKATSEIIKMASDFIDKSGGEKMLAVATVKDRNEAIGFLTNLMIGGRELLKSGKAEPHFFEEAQATLNNLERNGNVALQMTNFVVNIG